MQHLLLSLFFWLAHCWHASGGTSNKRFTVNFICACLWGYCLGDLDTLLCFPLLQVSSQPSLVPRGQNTAQISRFLLASAQGACIRAAWVEGALGPSAKLPVGMAGQVDFWLACPSQQVLWRAPGPPGSRPHSTLLWACWLGSFLCSLESTLAPLPRARPTSPSPLFLVARFAVFLGIPTALGVGAYRPVLNSSPLTYVSCNSPLK